MPTTKAATKSQGKSSQESRESTKGSHKPSRESRNVSRPNGARVMEDPRDLRELFILQLQDLRFAEEQILTLLTSAKEAASNNELVDAIKDHQEESRQHLEFVEEILQAEQADTDKECFAIEGLCKEAQEAIDCESPVPVKDAAIIAALQRIEHYEIAGYGTVLEFAKLLEESDYQEKLEEILSQEKKADKTLSKIATGAWMSEVVNDLAKEDTSEYASEMM